MNISLIIVHWNTPELLRKQLLSLTSQSGDIDFFSTRDAPSDNEGRAPSETKKTISKRNLIVVDNASDESLDWIRKEFPDIFLVQNKKNVGYAAACNIGAKLAGGNWLLFLNPDVTITSDLIKQLIKSSEEKSFDAASPRSSSMGYDKPLPTPLSLLIEFTPLKWILPVSLFPQKTLFGGCLLIKKDVLKKIGGWDEKFFLWFEDSDLTRRLIDASYKIGYIDTEIPHGGGTSLKRLSQEKQRQIFFHSMNLYAQKYFSFFGKLVVTALQRKYR